MPPLIAFNGCSTCSLKMEWGNMKSCKMPAAVPSKPSEYRVLVLGEAPGEQDDITGIPFNGETGKMLRDAIPKEWQKKLYWQNCVRCHSGRTPTERELQCCSTYLKDDIARINPHAILGIGTTAVKHFWPSQNISDARGTWMPVKNGQGTSWFYSTFQPSYVLKSARNTEYSKIPNTVLPVFEGDIRRFFEAIPNLQAPQIAAIPAIHYPKSEQEAQHLFDRLKDTFAIDIETHKKKPYLRDARLLTAALSDGDLTFAFPVDWPGDINPWGKAFLKKVLSSGRTWIAHGASFELVWIWYLTQLPNQKFHDTMAAGRVFHKRPGILSLEDQGMIHLGRNFKSETEIDRKNLINYPKDLVLKYNALDAYPTALIFNKIKLNDIESAAYTHLLDSIRSTVAMELAGLNVNLRESEALEKHFHTKEDEYQGEAKQLSEVRQFEREIGSFSLSQPAAVGFILTKFCGLQLPKTPSGGICTDDPNLEKLAGKHPLVDITRDYRGVQRLRSTYVTPVLNGTLLGADGLLHPSYTTVHTRTYRLSSEDPNIQNWPKRKHRELRKQVVAPPGFIFVSCDYGQLEARVFAMASKDIALSASIIRKNDIHTKWLNRIIDLHPLYLDRLAEKTNQTEEKKIRKAGRDIVKTDFVFASFFGSIAKSVAGRALLPYRIAEQVLGEFWGEYCQARQWVDSQFELYSETGRVHSLTGRERDGVLDGNEPINTPIQGTAAEIVLSAQNALFARAINEDIFLMPRINIHDDLTFLMPDDSDLERRIEIVTSEIVLPRYPFISVPLMTEAKVGYDWANLEAIGLFEGKYFPN